MFRIPDNETFAAKVEARIPTDRPDRFIEGDFTAVFNHVSKDRYAEIIDGLGQLAGDQIDEEGRLSVGKILDYKTRVLDDVLVRVEGIGDGAGNPLDPDEQVRQVKGRVQLLNATFDAFLAAHNGAAAKNSKPSRKP